MSRAKKKRLERANRGATKRTIKSRTDRAALVGTLAATSPIWQAQSTVSTAGTKLVAAGVKLAADEASVTSLDAQAAAARTARDADLVAYDAAFEVYASTTESYSVTAQDLQGLALDPQATTVYGIAEPLDLTGKYDPTTQIVEAHIKCAPGMRRCIIEISTDQTMATGLKQFPGDGARQSMAGLPPGTYWLHAAHIRAAERSAFTGPIAVIVK